MNSSKLNRIIRVAKLFYEEHLTQQDIANIEEISPASVSRFLKKAEELGLVKHTIELPAFSTVELENSLKNKYGIKKVTVVPDFMNNEESLIKDLNRTVLEDLNKLVKNGDTIGLAWGNTITNLSEEAKNLKPFNKTNVNLVQLYGGISPLLNDSGSTDVILSIAKLFNAEAYQVCAPAYVEDKTIAHLLKRERQISNIISKQKECDIAIFSAAPFDKNGFIFTLGSLEDKDIKSLEENEAIGDICIHFLDKNGEIADPDLDERVIGIDLNDLKTIPEKILIVYGQEKASIVDTILNKGLVDRLYIDEDLANLLLDNKKS